jgi:low affinity Fe/Cu permease
MAACHQYGIVNSDVLDGIFDTQNRDSAAIHIKLDELIRSIEGAHNALLIWKN